jgi:hypothetical protein
MYYYAIYLFSLTLTQSTSLQRQGEFMGIRAEAALWISMVRLIANMNLPVFTDIFPAAATLV